MLRITVPGIESFDEERNRFTTVDDTVLELEHSLVSLSKWEEKYEKPFLGLENPTTEEILDYIGFMSLGGEIPPEVFSRMTEQNLVEINNYLNSRMTATWFTDSGKKASRGSETITAELIYYWMSVFNIPLEFSTWHLNKLFTLIKIHGLKNNPDGKKMSRREVAQQYRELNEQRKTKLGTSG